ncbi:non-specific lipid transfer protein GPI-anchored 11-like isoform X2 [Andrographis paniculata]|uniref:non-specific lipid transfer protein GPI-anchored 11-like isoform X2 n=1 Tax=Andrographis paniculata TaxID=175694 RepID=UPI0021E8603C|nr:non-specific lipid transfer protein GPI-anchored 11-like isoform X2 [Andrographis paniculata]
MPTAKHAAVLLAAIFIAAAAQPSPAPSKPRRPAAAAPPTAAAPAPAPGLDCTMYLTNMIDCLSYVENGSNTSRPEKACCTELANLVNTQPICLCELLGHSDRVPFPIDINRALKLPSLCKVSTPPVTLCAAIGIPVAAPGPNGAPAAGSGSSDVVPSPSVTDSLSDGSSSPQGSASVAAAAVSNYNKLIHTVGGVLSIAFIYYYYYY